MLSGFKFRGGIHPDYFKLTAGSRVRRADLPKEVILPLRQHVGAVCESLIEEGERVKVGQKIADSESPVSSPIHATISGTVAEISVRSTPTGERVRSIRIESDGRDRWLKGQGIDPEKSSREEILAKIRENGIVGLGGAAFPTHVKLNPPEGKRVDTVIINGAECEPYITADHRLMVEESRRIVRGAKIIAKVLGAERVIFAVEDNKPDAVERLRKATSGDFEVLALKTKYPQGDERHLIKAVLNREVPPGGLPFDVGVVVQNVGTAKAICDAVCDGIPLVERVVTVTGDVRKPGNLLVRIGTLFSNLIEQCGGPVGAVRKVISGGPMMGIAQSEDVPVIKGTNCILVFSERRVVEEEEMPCIRCGRCVDVCPMGLMPFMIRALVEKGKFDACSEYDIMSCDECGCCAYVCPAKIPLVQIIKRGKMALASAKEVGR